MPKIAVLILAISIATGCVSVPAEFETPIQPAEKRYELVRGKPATDRICYRHSRHWHCVRER